MKISYMLKRENFYDINEKTLKKYYDGCNASKKLYIYPELNAIITARPSKAVKKYLYTEYRVSGSFLKRIAVRAYAFAMLNSFGLLAAKNVELPTSAGRDTLIYPCNKKYRIFDFDKNTVSVTPKEGFPTGDLINEIEFRKNANADFVPSLISYSDNGYTERIIDGYPVARSVDRERELSDRAYSIWETYFAPFRQSVDCGQYAEELLAEIDLLLGELEDLAKSVDRGKVFSLAEKLSNEMCACGGKITLSLSHGDLQSGNIWVENGTDKIYIIDWESYGTRSVEYDRATLYDGIRKVDKLADYVKLKDATCATVLLEDIVFRLKELKNLPEDFGAEDFERYIKILEERYV